jgi:hypothetical protein
MSIDEHPYRPKGAVQSDMYFDEAVLEKMAAAQ